MGHGSHGSHGSYNDNTTSYNYDFHKPVTLDWDYSISAGRATNSVEAIKELREKIKWLQQNKAAPGESPNTNPPLNWSGAKNEEFDGVGVDYIEDVQYDTIRDNLDTLFQHIKGQSTGLSEAEDGQPIQKEGFEQLINKTNQLSEYDAGAYANHNNHDSHGSYTN